MTVSALPRESSVDIWQALADPTRRALIDRLATGPRTTTQLTAGFAMSRFGVMKHLGVLERAGLVVARRQGRYRLNCLNLAPLHAIQSRWVPRRGALLAGALERFSAHPGGHDMPDLAPTPATGILDLALEWPVAASIQRAWEAFFGEPDRWWPAELRATGPGAVMRFEARLDGQLREENPGGGGVLWYRVFGLDPMRSVDLIGHLAARYGGPAASMLHVEWAPGETDGSCLLKLTDSIVGRIGPGMRQSVSSGWQSIIGEGLVAHLGGGEKRQ